MSAMSSESVSPGEPSAGPADAAAPTLARGLAAMATAVIVMVATLWAVGLWRGAGLVDGPVSEGGWTGRSRAWFIARGVYPSELDPGSSRSFTWTHRDGSLRIPTLDRSG
jgi:hypothetical protein